MLHKRRKRLEELAAREAAGETFWTNEFDSTIRTKILHAARDAGGYDGGKFYAVAHGLILRDEGLQTLSGSHYTPSEDLFNFLLQAPDDTVPTVIEALSVVFADRRVIYETHRSQASLIFDTSVSTILREHRISFDLIDHRMVEFASREMHTEVVAPALLLLAGNKGLAAAESAYQDALAEISKGSPDDAITDAGTALQETLISVGCEGNALGPLIKSARAKGLLAPHDSPMLEVVERILSWVSADRSQMGDAHRASTATISDAWFIVHVVGAIILRLAGGGGRA